MVHKFPGLSRGGESYSFGVNHKNYLAIERVDEFDAATIKPFDEKTIRLWSSNGRNHSTKWISLPIDCQNILAL